MSGCMRAKGEGAQHPSNWPGHEWARYIYNFTPVPTAAPIVVPPPHLYCTASPPEQLTVISPPTVVPLPSLPAVVPLPTAYRDLAALELGPVQLVNAVLGVLGVLELDEAEALGAPARRRQGGGDGRQAGSEITDRHRTTGEAWMAVQLPHD